MTGLNPRVRITSSRRPTEAEQPVATGPKSLAQEVRAQTQLGEVYLTGLIRAQLRLALRVIVVGVLSLGGLPLVFHLLPATRRATVVGMPFAWLVLGVLVYPTAVLVARQYVRASERLEAEFSAMVNQSHQAGPPP